MTPLQIGFIVAVIVIIPSILVVPGFLRRKRHERLMEESFSAEWMEILKKRVPLYFKLPEALQRQLQGHINIFLKEKTFIGCQGIEVDDEIRVTIAAQACMLIMNRKSTDYKDLLTIYVYPTAYICRQKQMTENGLVVESEGVNLGESWSTGRVVLSWDDSAGGARNLYDGHNVVMHEFAHQLDQETGDTDGCPILDQRTNYFSWGQVLSEEYKELVEDTMKHRKSVMDKYGATNPAEFFAVATETFFEKPEQLHKKHPELYDQLKNYYHLDPESWL